jgi:inner membrane protein
MANGKTHRLVAAATVGAYLAHAKNYKDQENWKPMAGAGFAAWSTNLPDVLEPAIHPHHRQFLHSWAFAGLLGYGLYKVYEWKPVNEWERTMRFFALVGGSAYLIHLAVDSLSARSLPLIGKLN